MMSPPAVIQATTSDDTKHTGDVTSIVLHDNFLYSSGGDGKVKVSSSDSN